MMRNPNILAGSMFLMVLVLSTGAWAGSRQLATGGATQIEGSAGGGLVPWAVITGYGAAEETDVTGFLSFVDTGDYELTAAGVAVGYRNRWEFSLATQELDLVTLGPALGLPGAELKQDIIGAKYRIAGDLIYTKMPQISAGVQYKKVDDFFIPSVAGAEDDDGFDVYLAVSKLFLAGAGGFNGFLNGTVRYTEANETGLLGFGGDRSSDHHLNLEAAAGIFLSRRWAVGAEYRQKSSNLTFAGEDDWWDVFVGYFPNRHFSVVAAYVDLGDIATLPGQTGWYLSLEGSF